MACFSLCYLIFTSGVFLFGLPWLIVLLPTITSNLLANKKELRKNNPTSSDDVTKKHMDSLKSEIDRMNENMKIMKEKYEVMTKSYEVKSENIEKLAKEFDSKIKTNRNRRKKANEEFKLTVNNNKAKNDSCNTRDCCKSNPDDFANQFKKENLPCGANSEIAKVKHQVTGKGKGTPTTKTEEENRLESVSFKRNELLKDISTKIGSVKKLFETIKKGNKEIDVKDKCYKCYSPPKFELESEIYESTSDIETTISCDCPNELNEKLNDCKEYLDVTNDTKHCETMTGSLNNSKCMPYKTKMLANSKTNQTLDKHSTIKLECKVLDKNKSICCKIIKKDTEREECETKSNFEKLTGILASIKCKYENKISKIDEIIKEDLATVKICCDDKCGMTSEDNLAAKNECSTETSKGCIERREMGIITEESNNCPASCDSMKFSEDFKCENDDDGIERNDFQCNGYDAKDEIEDCLTNTSGTPKKCECTKLLHKDYDSDDNCNKNRLEKLLNIKALKRKIKETFNPKKGRKPICKIKSNISCEQRNLGECGDGCIPQCNKRACTKKQFGTCCFCKKDVTCHIEQIRSVGEVSCIEMFTREVEYSEIFESQHCLSCSRQILKRCVCTQKQFPGLTLKKGDGCPYKFF